MARERKVREWQTAKVLKIPYNYRERAEDRENREKGV